MAETAGRAAGKAADKAEAEAELARAQAEAVAQARAEAAAHVRTPRSRLYLALGWLMVGLGLVGAVLPLMPTTIFMILAAGFFTRGSPRARAWLLGHRLFGRAIVRWELTGGIPRKAKGAAVVAMAAAFLLSLVLGVPSWVLAVQALVLVSAGAWILTRPD